MAYRNGTYVAFDGNGISNPTQSDFKYYAIVQGWNKSKNHELNFSDSHQKTYRVKDISMKRTLENRLLERMRNSKHMVVILSEDTNWDRGMLNFEIEQAVDYYKIPIIIAYVGYEYILDPNLYKRYWPKALKERIENKTAKCIHIPFKEKAVMAAISQFGVNSQGENNILNGSLCYYNRDAYANWGYI